MEPIYIYFIEIEFGSEKQNILRLGKKKRSTVKYEICRTIIEKADDSIHLTQDKLYYRYYSMMERGRKNT